MMASHVEMEIQGDGQQQLEGEPDMDRMAQQVQIYLSL